MEVYWERGKEPAGPPPPTPTAPRPLSNPENAHQSPTNSLLTPPIILLTIHEGGGVPWGMEGLLNAEALAPHTSSDANLQQPTGHRREVPPSGRSSPKSWRRPTLSKRRDKWSLERVAARIARRGSRSAAPRSTGPGAFYDNAFADDAQRHTFNTLTGDSRMDVRRILRRYVACGIKLPEGVPLFKALKQVGPPRTIRFHNIDPSMTVVERLSTRRTLERLAEFERIVARCAADVRTGELPMGEIASGPDFEAALAQQLEKAREIREIFTTPTKLAEDPMFAGLSGKQESWGEIIARVAEEYHGTITLPKPDGTVETRPITVKEQIVRSTIDFALRGDSKARSEILRRMPNPHTGEPEGEPPSIHRLEDWRTEAIKLIAAGQITYDDAVLEFGKDLADELFRSATSSVSFQNAVLASLPAPIEDEPDASDAVLEG